MSAVFLKILNMSITAGWLILAVLAARLLLKRAPRWISCLLWGLVGLRLLCPFSLKSVFSLIPTGQTVPANIAYSPHPAIQSGVAAINEAVNPVIERAFTPAPAAGETPLLVWLPVLTGIWLTGAAVLLFYAAFSYAKLKASVSASVRIRDGVLACDEIQTPFILGVFRPVIYVPSSLRGETLERVLEHENAHLLRRDHWWKPLGYVLLAVHWFNPLCWLAYVLLCRDIEAACDERVIRDLDRESVAAYSQALLDCSLPRSRITACPLAFGETGVKQRIKSVLSYKKPAFWIILSGLIVCAVLAVCLLTDPAEDEPGEKTVLDRIRESSSAPVKLELPGGASCFAEHNLEGLKGFADLRIREASLTPEDGDEDWRCRMTFYPSERVKGAEQIVVSFHDSYVQIGSEYWLPEEGVPYESILEWAAAKVDYYFTKQAVPATVCWFDGRYGDEMLWEGSRETTLPDFPGVSFRWQADHVDAVSKQGSWTLYTGMPIWSVWFCDLNGDGRPELCSSLSWGSGIVDERIAVFDYVNGALYELADRGNYDYLLREQDGELIVEKYRYSNPEDQFVETGRLSLWNGVLAYVPDDPANKVIPLTSPGTDGDAIGPARLWISWTARTAHADWADDAALLSACRNPEQLNLPDEQHFPVYTIASVEELEAFNALCGAARSPAQGYEELPSFRELCAAYDEAFFADHALVLAYVKAPNAFRYALHNCEIVPDAALCLEVTQSNDPETHDDAAAGWFVIAELAGSDYALFTDFDARFLGGVVE